MHKAFLRRIVDEGPIPAAHGVVRWRASDLIMRLHEEFGLSVSDDTIYRALKDLGFSYVSARPKAYKQDPALAWISTEQSGHNTMPFQGADFGPFHPDVCKIRYPIWCPDSLIAPCDFASPCVVFLDFRVPARKVTPRRLPIRAPYRIIERRKFLSHLNPLSNSDVSGIRFRGNPG